MKERMILGVLIAVEDAMERAVKFQPEQAPAVLIQIHSYALTFPPEQPALVSSIPIQVWGIMMTLQSVVLVADPKT